MAGRCIANSVHPPYMDLVLDGFIRFFADNDMLVGGVDLFCGIGGSSWGAHRAGLRVLLAIDACQTAVNYYSLAYGPTAPAWKHAFECVRVPPVEDRDHRDTAC